MSGAKRRLNKFTDKLSKEFPYIKKTKVEGSVQCEICNGLFSITSGGKRDISRHTESEKHKKFLQSSASTSKLTTFFRKEEFGSTEKKLSIAEALFSFHTVNHNHSFRSMDCTSKLIQKLFEQKFACARTKTEAIIKKVLYPYAMENLNIRLQSVSFISAFSDASNHKDIKLFPSLIRYFDSKFGVQIKILDFVSLPGETAELISNSIIEILTKYDLTKKLVAYCADNANTNFGGVARKGTNNIFSKLNNSLEQSIIGVGCAAHIIHNTIQTAADLLPLDVEHIIIKIYGYFYIYTVRVESLKEFCSDVEVEYHKILGYSKTRWLALMPAIERILKMYIPLKSYFMSIEKCPTVLENFFKDDSSELWLKFLHNQASLFHNVIKNVEGNTNTIMEIAAEINILKIKCKERLENDFVPLTIRSELQNLVENVSVDKNWFMGHVRNFYANCLQYLEKWSSSFADIVGFDWIELKTQINWKDVEKSHLKIVTHFPNNNNINENELFDEISYLKTYVNEEKLLKWHNNKIFTDIRWVEVFTYFEGNFVPCNNLKKIVEFALCLPGTNAPTERIFSMVNKLWTTEKTQLTVETLKAILTVKTNFAESCDEFLSEISENENLLKKIHSAEKYL